MILDSSGILKLEYDAPDLDIEELRRYTKTVENTSEEIETLLMESVNELMPELKYCIVCRKIQKENFELLGLNDIDYLNDAEMCILFGATIGIGPDRLINRYSRISPSKAFLFQGIGTERVESLCNKFQEEVRKEAESNGFEIKPRISPGYGKFELSFQTKLFQILELQKRAGITLNESLLMTPSKSVTAVVPLFKKEAGKCPENFESAFGCENCSKTECLFKSNR